MFTNRSFATFCISICFLFSFSATSVLGHVADWYIVPIEVGWLHDQAVFGRSFFPSFVLHREVDLLVYHGVKCPLRAKKSGNELTWACHPIVDTVSSGGETFPHDVLKIKDLTSFTAQLKYAKAGAGTSQKTIIYPDGNLEMYKQWQYVYFRRLNDENEANDIPDAVRIKLGKIQGRHYIQRPMIAWKEIKVFTNQYSAPYDNEPFTPKRHEPELIHSFGIPTVLCPDAPKMANVGFTSGGRALLNSVEAPSTERKRIEHAKCGVSIVPKSTFRGTEFYAKPITADKGVPKSAMAVILPDKKSQVTCVLVKGGVEFLSPSKIDKVKIKVNVKVG